jgi:predicted dehydrogenase
MADKIRVGFVGAGGNTRLHHIPKLKKIDGVELVSVANRTRASSERVAQEFGIARVHESYEGLICDPELDLVYVATPPCMHAEQAIAVINAGKAVLVEKPFAMNASQARAVFALAAQRGVSVFEAMHSPHHMLFGRVLEIVTSGEIGQVRHIDAEFGVPGCDRELGRIIASSRDPLHFATVLLDR